MKAKAFFCITLLIFVISPSLFAGDEELFLGNWSWEEPQYEEGVMAISGYLDYTLEVSKNQDQYLYSILDENGEELHQGAFRAEEGILTLTNPEKEERQYTYRENFFGSFELCEYHDYPSQNVYFSLSPKETSGENPTEDLSAREYAQMARSANDAEDYWLAIEYAESGIQSDSEYSSCWFQLGFAYGCLGYHTDAVSAYEKVLSIRPDDEAAQNNLEWNRDRM